MSIDLFGGLSDKELMMELGWRMSRISEVAWGKYWYEAIDEEVPRACYEIAATGTPGYHHSISVVSARLLVALAERLGHWVVPNRGQLGWKPYVPKAMKKHASRTEHGAKKTPTAD